jgi:CCR4-NOT transcription complex subunit 7/8
MRCNVDLLKIIQVGITLADEDGRSPPECSTWQFNFKFSIGCVILLFNRQEALSDSYIFSEDMYAPESIDLLQKSGIDFTRHEEIGIVPNDFAELMVTSGLVLSDDTKWVSFHRFAYCLLF